MRFKSMINAQFECEAEAISYEYLSSRRHIGENAEGRTLPLAKDKARAGARLLGALSLACRVVAVASFAFFPVGAVAQSSDGQANPTPGQAADLAKQLSNPVASLISVPFQLNYDTGIGQTDADRWVLNVQPVIPFDLSENWNLISRTIVPFINLDSPVFGGSDTSGLGDIVQSFFFSPKAPTKGGWIWGAGPVLLLPTGKDEFSSDNWGIGPTFVALKQQSGWTYGALVNHIWGVDSPSGGRDKTDATFLQPFLTYTTPDAWTFSINAEASYDWNTENWTAPLNIGVSKLVHFGKQPVSFQLAGRPYLDSPSGGPDWGLRFSVTFLFPK